MKECVDCEIVWDDVEYSSDYDAYLCPLCLMERQDAEQTAFDFEMMEDCE